MGESLAVAPTVLPPALLAEPFCLDVEPCLGLEEILKYTEALACSELQRE
jgi:hypothetical protein